MRNQQDIGLDFIIDKLTNSIENILTGDSFPTEVTLVSSNDLKSVTKVGGFSIGNLSINSQKGKFIN